ncbi:hypothetical protein [Thermoactinospora rubra]|uniref:hypothetical protein n=1 Tax=Thermoactinospora rubra TaxID=1088767 RepID=UPI000A11F5FB|nr:hypothetical protein [Thermoactinospora rubra]
MRFAAITGVTTLALLAAPAPAAQAAPPEGKYWQVAAVYSMTHPRPVGSGYWLAERRASTEWLTPDGRAWHGYRPLGARPLTPKDEAAWKADGSPTSWSYRTEGMKITLSAEPGKGYVKQDENRPRGFDLTGEAKFVSYQELQALPAQPAALRARLVADIREWMAKAAEEAKTTDPKAKPEDWTSRLDFYVAEGLARLMYANPVPKPVRAAAFEALKSTKGVQAPGRAKDLLGRAGQRLTWKDSGITRTVLVDTGTMTLLSSSFDAAVKAKSRVETYTKVGWTDDEPAVPAAS